VIARRPTHHLAAQAVKNATSAGKSATLLAPAPSQRVTGVAEVTAAASAVETTAALSGVGVGVEARKPGMADHQSF